MGNGTRVSIPDLYFDFLRLPRRSIKLKAFRSHFASADQVGVGQTTADDTAEHRFKHPASLSARSLNRNACSSRYRNR